MLKIYYFNEETWLLQLFWKAHSIELNAGLDAYFFLNLIVGQPSNNIDLSEIEIYLGMMIIKKYIRKDIKNVWKF